MSGHSKWANIQHRKGAQDAKRGKLFSKLIREITVVTRLGGDDQAANPRLRDAVARAHKNGLKRDTIENAIKRGSGNMEGCAPDFVRYEGYGPGGAALLIQGLTDNRNRAIAEVRYVLSKYGGKLGAEGSVAYLFERRGVLTLKPGVDEEQVMEIVLDYPVNDLITDGAGLVTVYTSPEHISAVQQILLDAELLVEHSEVTYVPITLNKIESVGDAHKLLNLVDKLDDLDDVQQVYCNAEISDVIAEQLENR